MADLTLEQRGVLAHTNFRPGHAGYRNGQKQAMAMRLLERGLLRRTERGLWFITALGAAALEATP